MLKALRKAHSALAKSDKKFKRSVKDLNNQWNSQHNAHKNNISKFDHKWKNSKKANHKAKKVFKAAAKAWSKAKKEAKHAIEKRNKAHARKGSATAGATKSKKAAIAAHAAFKSFNQKGHSLGYVH